MITPAQQAILDDFNRKWEGTSEQLAARMGITVTDTDPNMMVATMPVAGNRQAYGLLHGGASAVLAETVGSIAAALHAGPDNIAVGIELNLSHHRSATQGLVTAVCTPLHVGRTISTFEIVLRDERDRRICTARLTCAVRPAHRAGLSSPS
ncbi:MAG TPA: hotdog fold thioesterase [Jatrophihabitans sp.]|nr:hotdog fold thioesterase [Jatrophihabitans sp.]